MLGSFDCVLQQQAEIGPPKLNPAKEFDWCHAAAGAGRHLAWMCLRQRACVTPSSGVSSACAAMLWCLYGQLQQHMEHTQQAFRDLQLLALPVSSGAASASSVHQRYMCARMRVDREAHAVHIAGAHAASSLDASSFICLGGHTQVMARLGGCSCRLASPSDTEVLVAVSPFRVHPCHWSHPFKAFKDLLYSPPALGPSNCSVAEHASNARPPLRRRMARPSRLLRLPEWPKNHPTIGILDARQHAARVCLICIRGADRV